MRYLLSFLLLVTCLSTIVQAQPGGDVPPPPISSTGGNPGYGGPTTPNGNPLPPIIKVKGCSQGYWKNHISDWSGIYRPTAPISSVFTNVNWTAVSFAGTGLSASTSLEAALNSGGGGLNNVYRQGVAALLNAAVYGARTGYNILIVQNEFKIQAESTKPQGEGLEDLALWCHGGKTPGTTPVPTPGGDVPPPPISVGDQYGNNGNSGYGNGNKTNDNGGKGKGNNTTNAGPPIVVSAVYSITYQANKKNAVNDLVKVMRSYAERAGIAKQNFIINGGDIQQNRTVTTRWSVKVGFKSKNPIERAMDLDRFTNFLYAQAGLGAIRTASGNGDAAPFTTNEEQVVAYNLETMSIQTCDDGSDISANDICPPVDESAAAAGAASPSTSSSSSLLPLIIGIAAAIVVLLILISSIIIIRRRRHNSIKAIANITADQVAQQV